jgi:dihydroorotate dehydrogenase (fumarate)
MEDHEYESVEQIKGIMCQKNCADPTAFERAQYTRALKSYSRSQPSTTAS